MKIVRLSTFTVFSATLLLFMAGFAWIASLGNPAATTALIACGETLFFVAATYLILVWLFRNRPPLSVSSSDERRRIIWFGLFALMLLGATALIVYAPTTATVELLKKVTVQGYVSSLDTLDIRLSTSYMPIWAQGLLEAARRFAATYCLLEFCFSPIFPKYRKLIGGALILILSFFVFAILDRVISVFYLAAIISALYMTRGTAIFKDRYFYMAIVGILATIVVFKQVQYGSFQEFEISQNPDISRQLAPEESSVPEASRKSKTDSGETQIPADRPPLDPRMPGSYVPPRSAPAEHPLSEYALGAARSVLERIVLSPLAMTLYSIENYDERSFKHWSTTRLFSLIGIGRFVDPRETGRLTHHDAFPVSFIGDLWRNGGMRYFPFYAIGLGVVLFWTDRRIFDAKSYLALQVICIFGVLFLFYGNAFNATSCLLIGSSLALDAQLLISARLWPGRTPRITSNV